VADTLATEGGKGLWWACLYVCLLSVHEYISKNTLKRSLCTVVYSCFGSVTVLTSSTVFWVTSCYTLQ